MPDTVNYELKGRLTVDVPFARASAFLLERRGRRPGKGFLVPLLVGQLYGSDIVVTAVFEGREVTNGIILYLNIRISLAFVSPGSLTGHFNSLSFLR